MPPRSTIVLSSRRAFTLVETLAVIILLAIVTAVGAAAYRALATGARQTAAQTLLAALEMARTEAVARQEPWPVLFRRSAEFAAEGSYSEYGLLHAANGDPAGRRVVWHGLPNGAWIYGGPLTSVSRGSNVLSAAQISLKEAEVKAAPEELDDRVTAVVFSELGGVVFPDSDGTPYYLAVAEGNPDASDGQPRVSPDLIEIRPATGRCQLITP